MNILFVASSYDIFINIDCGAAVRSNNLVKAFLQLGHVDVISFNKEKVKSNLPDCNVVYSEYIPYNTKKWPKSLVISKRLRLIFTPWNPKAYYAINKKREEVIDEFVKNNHYDLIVCRYLNEAITCGLMKYSKILVVDVDDNPVTVHKREYKKNTYSNFFSKYLSYYETLTISFMCKCFLKKVYCSFYSNKFESPCSKSVLLHNVSTALTQNQPITNKIPKRLLMVGWLDYLPNRDGAIHFVKHVFPIIRNSIPDVELHIVGKTDDSKLFSTLNKIDGVRVLGYVSDLNEEYKNSRVVVIPIYQGAGTSVKFAEGLMMMRPIVSSPMGCRGYDDVCKPDEHFMLANNDIEFAEKSILLLNSIDLSNTMSHAAFDLYNRYFSRERFLEIVKDVICNPN